MPERNVPIATSPELMTADEFARQVGVSRFSTDRWATEGRGPRRIKIGKRVYYLCKEVREWLFAGAPLDEEGDAHAPRP